MSLKFFGSNVVITCDEIQARTLLLYGGHSPGFIASIQKAFLSAGLPIDYPDPVNDFQRHVDRRRS